MRSVALDTDALASGSADHGLRIWDARHSERSLFDLGEPNRTLKSHTGPVVALSLTEANLFSGSWDASVRVWSRSTWECSLVLKYEDWVTSAVARGSNLMVAAGLDVVVHDVSTAQKTRHFQNLHQGKVTCLEGTRNGKMMFTAAGDGLIMAHDLRLRDPSVLVWHHVSGVLGLAFEDPWLASSSRDGTVMLMNTEAGLKNAKFTTSSTRRQLQGQQGPGYCVDISEQWLACGSESEVVRTWDFSHASEHTQRAAEARASRNRRRGRRKNHRQNTVLAGDAGSGPSTSASGSNSMRTVRPHANGMQSTHGK